MDSDMQCILLRDAAKAEAPLISGISSLRKFPWSARISTLSRNSCSVARIASASRFGSSRKICVCCISNQDRKDSVSPVWS